LRIIGENRRADRVWLAKQQFASHTISSTTLPLRYSPGRLNQDASNVLRNMARNGERHPSTSASLELRSQQELLGTSFSGKEMACGSSRSGASQNPVLSNSFARRCL
jgi:hypothetical protein